MIKIKCQGAEIRGSYVKVETSELIYLKIKVKSKKSELNPHKIKLTMLKPKART